MFLHGPLARMKKNVLPDYPTDDGPNGFYFQMKNTLNHRVNRIPSGLAVISRAQMETSVSFLDSGKNLTMLHEAIKTGVCHPHLLLLQTVSTLSSRSGKLLFLWACLKANKCLDKVYFHGHQHLNRGFRVPFTKLSLFVFSTKEEFSTQRSSSLLSLGLVLL